MTDKEKLLAVFDDEILRTADYVTNRLAGPYKKWTTPDDIRQHIHQYAYGGGKKHLAKWLADGEPHRVVLAFYAVARQHCEKEKAAASGYEVTDLAWYSPENVAKWLPLALDPAWDGTNDVTDETEFTSGRTPAFEGGSLLATVADVRGALRACPDAAFTVRHDSDDAEAMAEACAKLSRWLGGEYPAAPGYRSERAAA